VPVKCHLAPIGRWGAGSCLVALMAGPAGGLGWFRWCYRVQRAWVVRGGRRGGQAGGRRGRLSCLTV